MTAKYVAFALPSGTDALMVPLTSGHPVTMFSQSVLRLAYYICSNNPRTPIPVVQKVVSIVFGSEVILLEWEEDRQSEWGDPGAPSGFVTH